jgi:hypothetical protein
VQLQPILSPALEIPALLRCHVRLPVALRDAPHPVRASCDWLRPASATLFSAAQCGGAGILLPWTSAGGVRWSCCSEAQPGEKCTDSPTGSWGTYTQVLTETGKTNTYNVIRTPGLTWRPETAVG